jgi:transposase
MEVMHQRCAGLDVHKETVVGCVRIGAGGEVSRDLKRFTTTTRGLLQLADWLRAAGCTAVAMEATGVYWKPVWHVLEGEFELVLANPAHIRNVPGRKSDLNDASWIADLLAHGLIRASFVPPPPILELRDLTRTRKQLVREIVQHQQRIQKVLEDANLKLASVVSDVVGASGRRMIRALIAGATDPHELAALGHPRLSASRETLAEALLGKVTAHHRFLLRQHLQVLEHLEQTVAEFEAQIEAALAPFRAAAERLMTIPGVSAIAAQVIIAEIGVDMRRFKTVGHLRSWAGLCPQLNESAGKVRSRSLRNGAPWLKTVLVQCAWAATRSKRHNYLGAQFLRLRARRGPKKAVLAVAASILTAAYFLLRDEVPYRDLGPHYFIRVDQDRTAQRLARRIRQLGYEVELRKAA